MFFLNLLFDVSTIAIALGITPYYTKVISSDKTKKNPWIE